MIAVVDTDFVLYSVACVGERRYITVIHKSSGREKDFENKTEFWGRSKDHSGGWLGELNKKRTSPFLPEEFKIIEKQEVKENVANVFHSAKLVVESAIAKTGANKRIFFIGDGSPTFRNSFATLLEYKGNRKDMLTPLLLGDVKDYLIRKYHPEIVSGIECDDAVCMEAYKSKNHVAIGIDKDFYGCPINVFNPNREDEGIVDCRGFGSLWLDKKGKVRGRGRVFHYWQAASHDNVDNYKANCFSKVKWGEKNAYNVLSKCKDDKEAWTDLKSIFQVLYPEPKKVVGWKGEEIEIDWLYVLNEMINLSHIHPTRDDFINTNDVLTSYGIL